MLMWTPLSVVLGIACTQIPWGNSEGFHGTGFPFAAVYWDYVDASKGPIDYLNPYAPMLNSIACFVVGSMIIISVHWVASRCVDANKIK